MSIVREAFVTSVTWTPRPGPPVRCQMSQLSIVPNSRSPDSAADRRSGPPASSTEASLSADEYVEIGSPVSARKRSIPSGSAAARRAHASAVRVSCHTIACSTGRPVVRDQTTVVSRWSLIPTAASARPSASTSRRATRMQVRTRSRISSASCSTQPGRGVIWACPS